MQFIFYRKNQLNFLLKSSKLDVPVFTEKFNDLFKTLILVGWRRTILYFYFGGGANQLSSWNSLRMKYLPEIQERFFGNVILVADPLFFMLSIYWWENQISS